MPDTLTALDATFLELEQRDAGALMNIGGVMVFDPRPNARPPTVQDICENLVGRLHQLPRYSQRLSSEHVGGLAWPSWVDDPAFDVRDHVGHMALPAPGGDMELCDWIAEFFSHPLDRTRPLWEIVLLEGLEGGRWGLAQKTHHCLVDGVGSVEILGLLLDADPTGRAGSRRPLRLRSPHPDHSRLPAPVSQAGRAGAKAVRAGAHRALHPGQALAESRALAELLVRDELLAAPDSSLNVPIGQTRRFAAVRASLAELTQVGRALGGSVNDVVLAACTSGLRHLLLKRGEHLPRALRAMVPVNVRPPSDQLGLGNRVSSLFPELPVGEPDELTRFTAIARSMRRLKRSGAAAGVTSFLDLAALAPPVVHAALARSAYATRLFNVTITNVPGPKQPLYALGSRLCEVHPFVPLAAEHAVGVAVFSYTNRVNFGISGDSAAVPDLGVLAYGIAEGIDELLAVAGIRS